MRNDTDGQGRAVRVGATADAVQTVKTRRPPVVAALRSAASQLLVVAERVACAAQLHDVARVAAYRPQILGFFKSDAPHIPSDFLLAPNKQPSAAVFGTLQQNCRLATAQNN